MGLRPAVIHEYPAVETLQIERSAAFADVLEYPIKSAAHLLQRIKQIPNHETLRMALPPAQPRLEAWKSAQAAIHSPLGEGAAVANTTAVEEQSAE